MDVDPFAPATGTVARIRAGELTARAALEAYLDRVERQRDLNAVVTVDAAAARAAADDLDAAARRGEWRGPLHGLPMTVKDAFATAGMRSTAGLPELADDVPAADAVAVARLRAAGAVVFGKTNVPPGITGQETRNALFGRTVNPWSPDRTPGGSSGGAAAALAAGLTGAEVGSDSGGSIRQPAHCCGVYGHVPTHGLVPLRGHRPQVDLDAVGKDVDLMVVGPLARSAGDLALLLGVLGGRDGEAAAAWPLRLPAPAAEPARLRVAAWLDDPDWPTDAAVLDVLDRLVAGLEAAGVPVDRAAKPPFTLDEAFDVAFRLWTASSSERTPADQVDELRRALASGRLTERLPRLRAQAETMDHRDWLLLDNERRRMQAGWREFFGAYDILLCPVIPVVAPPHDPDPDPAAVADVDHRLALTVEVNGEPRPYLSQLTWNVVVGMAGLPATAAPAGRSADGLPVGVQVVGSPFADLTTIAFAGFLDRFTGGFTAAPAVRRR